MILWSSQWTCWFKYSAGFMYNTLLWILDVCCLMSLLEVLPATTFSEHQQDIIQKVAPAIADPSLNRSRGFHPQCHQNWHGVSIPMGSHLQPIASTWTPHVPHASIQTTSLNDRTSSSISHLYTHQNVDGCDLGKKGLTQSVEVFTSQHWYESKSPSLVLTR